PLQQRLTDIVAIALAGHLAAMRRAHDMPSIVVQTSCQKKGPRCACGSTLTLTVLAQHRLHLIPQLLRQDRRMLAVVRSPAMGNAADIKGIAQQVIECAPAVAHPTLLPAAARDPSLADDVLPPQLGLQRRHRAKLQVPLEYVPNTVGFPVVDGELPA